MDGNIGVLIVNTITFVVMVWSIIYLIVGAYLNARREAKGKPKKKRTSMIIFALAMMAIAYVVFYTVNPMPN